MQSKRLTVLLAAVVISTTLLSACDQRPRLPKTPVTQEVPESTSQSGTFNLQKRHGLGGWSKPAGVTEAELMHSLENSGSQNARQSLQSIEEHR
jgi:hypothetical protein